jgi:leucyl aminopeptidase
MSKKRESSLGAQFYKEFADLRERDPYDLASKVVQFLDEHDIEYNYENPVASGLIYEYFGQNVILSVNPDRSCSKELIGKGVCFDTGGWNLKQNMQDMYFDKTGAILAIAASLDTGVPARVFFVYNDLQLVPGTILSEPTTKKRVIIDNTDAEGRIGLAELLATSKKKKAITIATLTGHAAYTMGKNVSALVHSSTPKKHVPLIIKEALNGNVELWPMPLHKKYDEAVLTKVKGADITNSAEFYGAGSQTAFSFLRHFYKGTLIHVDMAAMDADKDHNNTCWGLNEIKYLLTIL